MTQIEMDAAMAIKRIPGVLCEIESVITSLVTRNSKPVGIDWEQRRFELVKAALTGCALSDYNDDVLSSVAIGCANTVIERLKVASVKEAGMGWRKWPEEKPDVIGEYLVRGVGGLNNKMHHWVCLWVGECDDKDISNKFFYGGNEFSEVPSGKFEFINANEL